LAIGLAVAPGSVLGEEKQKKPEFTSSTHGDWVLRCPKEKTSETPQPCTLTQQIIAEKAESPIATVIFVYGGNPSTLHAILRVPLGVALPPGMKMEIDKGKTHPFNFSHCEPGGCVVTSKISSELRNELESGSKANIGFLSMVGRKIVVPASLRGITAGLKALKKP